jgi:hypothetical protein
MSKNTDLGNLVNGLFVDSSRRVGIGTQTPSYILDIYSTTAARVQIQGTTNFSATQYTNTGGSFYLGIDDSAGANFTGTAYGRFLYSTGAYPMVFLTNGTECMRITSTGNVGIGTTSPISKLNIVNNGTTLFSNQVFSNSSSTASLAMGVAGSAVVATFLQNNAYLINSGNSSLIFGTNDAERMRISSTGVVGIAAAPNAGYSADYKLQVGVETSTNGIMIRGSSSGIGKLSFDAGTNGEGLGRIWYDYSVNSLLFYTSSNGTNSFERIRITSGGAINILGSYFIANSGTGYRFNNQADSFNNFIISDNGNASLRGALTQNASDERLKNNIKIIPNAIDKIKQLKGVSFEWNQELYETSRTTDIGVIAQDIQKVLPDAVSLAPFDTNFDDYTSKSGENYLTVYYEKIIPLLIEGIKEQENKIQKLSAEIEILKQK